MGQGETCEQPVLDAKSAIRFHVRTFGPEGLEDSDATGLEVFVTEAEVAV